MTLPTGSATSSSKGPYRSWDHRHTFVAEGDRTRIIDVVHYSLPLGPLGELAHAAVVRGQLEEIFRHRARTIQSIFARPSSEREPDDRGSGRWQRIRGRWDRRRALLARPPRRGLLSRRGESARGPLPDSVEIRNADAAGDNGLVEALAGVDALVIALAFKNSPMESPARGQTFMQVDAAGTEHLVAAARRAGVRQILYLSGAGAAADARQQWFRAKWRAEQAVRGSGLAWTILQADLDLRPA